MESSPCFFFAEINLELRKMRGGEKVFQRKHNLENGSMAYVSAVLKLFYQSLKRDVLVILRQQRNLAYPRE